MKNLLFYFLLLSSILFAKLHTIVSIMPQQTFLKAIGGDKITIDLMVPIGASPHTYEPKPSQMIAISKAELYFTIGVEFEKIWLNKFDNLNPKMKNIHLEKGILQIHTAHKHQKHTARTDPHIWTSPANVKIIVKNIYEALAKYDPSNQSYYYNNLQKYISKIENTDKKIKQELSTLKNSRHFMVFHPSWGYFAKAYNLEQIAVEIEGKSPKPKELIEVLKKAKAYKISAIFTQAEFSDSMAQIISKELSIPVIKVSPLAPNWSENLINIANAIAGNK